MKPEIETLISRGEFHSVLNELNSPKDPFDYYYLAYAWIYLGDYEETEKYLEQLSKTDFDNQDLHYRLNHLHLYFRYKKGEQIFLIKEIEALIDELSLDEIDLRTAYIAEFYDLLGLINAKIGEMDLAYQYLTQAVELSQNHYRADVSGMIYNDIGIVQIYSGEYMEAMNYLKFAEDIFQDLGHESFLGIATGNIGKLYRVMGSNELAIEYATKSLALKEHFGNTHDLSAEMVNIAILHQILKEYDLAEGHFQKALEIRKEIDNPEEISQTLYYLVLLYLEINEKGKAKSSYISHSELLSDSFNRSILQRDKIMQASMYKSSEDLAETFNAQQLFADIIEEPVIKLDQTIYCLFQLIDILLMEYKLKENQESLDKIFHYLNVLNDIARKQRIFSLIVEILLLQSRLYLLQFDIEKAQAVIMQSQVIIEEHGFETLLPKITKEQEKLTNLFMRWKDIVSTKTPLAQRIEQSDIVSYLGQLSKVMSYR